MQLILIRHGEAAGDPHAHCQPPVNGYLTDEGCSHAGDVASALRGVRFDRIFSSPLGRAIQTAQPLASQADRSIEILPWLIEWRPCTVTDEVNDAQYEQIMADAGKIRPEMAWKTPAGEGTLEMAHRVIVGFLQLMEKLGVHPAHGGYLVDPAAADIRVALVAHGGSLGRLLSFLLGVPIQPYAPIAFAHGGIAVVDLQQRVDVWYPVLQIPPLAARPH